MKYTPEIVAELIKYIEDGNYVTTACQAVGISRETYYQWLKDEDKPDITDEIIQKAEATAIIKNLKTIQAAANKSWQAAAWFLERKDYESWGRKELVGGIPDKPMKVDLSGLSIEELKALAYGYTIKNKSTGKKGDTKTGKDRAGS